MIKIALSNKFPFIIAYFNSPSLRILKRGKACFFLQYLGIVMLDGVGAVDWGESHQLSEVHTEITMNGRVRVGLNTKLTGYPANGYPNVVLGRIIHLISGQIPDIQLRKKASSTSCGGIYIIHYLWVTVLHFDIIHYTEIRISGNIEASRGGYTIISGIQWSSLKQP